MAGSYVAFVEQIIYGTALAPNPNHRDWLALGLTGGTDWLTHYLDRMLPAYEAWTVAEGLPPVTAWDGTRRAPWDATQDLPPGPDLDGSFTGIADLNALGSALRARLLTVASVARELNGPLKAPFSYRFWGYAKWAWVMRQRFLGNQVFPTGVVHDRDGTMLSAVEFLDTFNDTHRSWHGAGAAPVSPTPFLRTTAGQRTARGILGASLDGEDFLRFHRENMELFHRWYARTEQPPVVPIDMGRPGGWPPTAPGTVNPPSPWVFDEAAVTSPSPFRDNTSPNQIGDDIEPSYHGTGHGQNTDIGPLSHNNYVPRFQNWHGWIDAQWWWREPRFAQSDSVTGVRARRFHPVQQDGSPLPGLLALSIVRDPSAGTDSIDPPNVVAAADLAAGTGTVRMALHVRDPFGRTLRMRIRAEVLDAAGAVVETVTVLRTIGAGGDHPLDTDFTEDITFADAFASDDPAGANPAVGFVNGRIRFTGNLWERNVATPDDPATSPDAGFVHEDITYLDLVREKQAPDVLIYLNLSTFSQDQVTSNMLGLDSRFDAAFYVVAQDRTTASFPMPAWPAALPDEMKGLVLGLIPASGLFDDAGENPEVVLWQEAVDAPIAGVSVELQGPPDKEDASLSAEKPQRFTWTGRFIFSSVNDAFTGLPPGGSRNARLRVTVHDRAGNAATAQALVRFQMAANPYMIDGPTPWLSVDTRVVAVRQGETRFNETMSPGRDPIEFLNTVVGRLNAGTSGTDTFDSLAGEGPGAALEYAQAIPNPSTGGSTPIFNFTFAKMRLQAAGGAVDVRAFFRSFRYAEPSLLFDTTRGYRAFDDGAGRVIPVLGFESETNGAALRSIPFFATPRVDPTASSLEDQTDTPNVFSFPAGPANERVRYFGAWLDINQPAARLPASFSNATPNGNGPYPPASLQSIRTLMRDFHQCMVTEIHYGLDPTEPLASPTHSDNLAQRNLAILSSDNPGDADTRIVEHSFELDLTRPRRQQPPRVVASVAQPAHGHAGLHRHDGAHGAAHDHGDHGHDEHGGHDPGHHEHDEHGEHDHGGHDVAHGPCASCGHDELDADQCCACCGSLGESGPLEPDQPRGRVSTFAFERLVHDEAMSIAMQREGGMRLMLDEGHHAVVEKFGAEAARTVRQSFPFIFHPWRWQQTAAVLDELMIVWNDLPQDSVARLFLPGSNAEEVASLRHLRHAPPTVRAEGNSSLRLDVGGVTYVPIPPVRGDLQAGVFTIELPAGIRAGSRYRVDVIQLRAGASVANGGFRIDINVSKADAIVFAVQRGVALLHERLSLIPRGDRNRPILARRLETERRRAIALSSRAGVPWTDPTVWTTPDGGVAPVTGLKLRVVLERVRIVDESEPWWKGRGEIEFEVRARSNDNGSIEQTTRLPGSGHYKAKAGDTIVLNRVVFEGFADKHLALRISAVERDTFDPDDNLGACTRVFQHDATGWIGQYGPFDEGIDPEDVGAWQVWYRIERA
jgi:hypothetical protein